MKSTQLWYVGIGLGAIVGASVAFAEGPGVLDRLKQAVVGTKISLTLAVEAAQKEVPDGKVIEVELAWNREPASFAADVLLGEKVKAVRIDAASGKTLGVDDARLDEKDVKELAEVEQSLGTAKITLAAAIEAAAKEVKGGRAIGVKVETKDGRPSYTVTFLQGEKVMEAEVDAASGEVTKTQEQLLPLALWTFDQAEVGQTPAGLVAKETHPGARFGEWKVTADPMAPTKPNVLTLTTQEPDATFNLGLFEKTAYTDLDLRVRVRANTGKVDQGGGLVWRCKDENNYYTCRINPLENNFRVYKVSGGKRSQFQTSKFKAESGVWYEVRVVMVRDRITCYANGKKYLEVTDDAFKDAGMIGLWTKADASSSFDNLAVYAPAAEKRKEEAKADEAGQGRKDGQNKDQDDD